MTRWFTWCMGRGSTKNLIRKVIECLAKGSRSVTDISTETGTDRTAIVKYLNVLKESGLIVEEQQGTSKIFTLVPNYRTDTYFGLPLDQQAEKNISSFNQEKLERANNKTVV